MTTLCEKASARATPCVAVFVSQSLPPSHPPLSYFSQPRSGSGTHLEQVPKRIREGELLLHAYSVPGSVASVLWLDPRRIRGPGSFTHGRARKACTGAARSPRLSRPAGSWLTLSEWQGAGVPWRMLAVRLSKICPLKLLAPGLAQVSPASP